MDLKEKKYPQVLILGVGNILMGDEGVGVRAVECLKTNYEIPENVEIIDGGTLGFELLDYIENKDIVYIIDAVQKQDLSPGEVICVDLKSQPNFYNFKISPHQIGISDLLHMATFFDKLPQKIQLIGIVPQIIEPCLELSDVVIAGINKAIEMLIDCLEEFKLTFRKIK